ncbi:unnamed protein product [Toxocara canis]|uniref:BFN domain-containing protein n=1 Tax=Toxocara canis TaxID=6265 RepID=A0A183U7C0_TOXCA|nr:unnamed protein product [Toxocara canis]
MFASRVIPSQQHSVVLAEITMMRSARVRFSSTSRVALHGVIALHSLESLFVVDFCRILLGEGELRFVAPYVGYHIRTPGINQTANAKLITYDDDIEEELTDDSEFDVTDDEELTTPVPIPGR